VSYKKREILAPKFLIKIYRVDDFSFANDVALSYSAFSFVHAVGKSHVTDGVRVAAKWWPVDAVRAFPRLVPSVFETKTTNILRVSFKSPATTIGAFGDG